MRLTEQEFNESIEYLVETKNINENALLAAGLFLGASTAISSVALVFAIKQYLKTKNFEIVKRLPKDYITRVKIGNIEDDLTLKDIFNIVMKNGKRQDKQTLKKLLKEYMKNSNENILKEICNLYLKVVQYKHPEASLSKRKTYSECEIGESFKIDDCAFEFDKIQPRKLNNIELKFLSDLVKTGEIEREDFNYYKTLYVVGQYNGNECLALGDEKSVECYIDTEMCNVYSF